MKTTDQKILDICSKLNIIVIESIDTLNNMLDFTVLDADGMPFVKTTEKILIIIDNEKYNETYLIDIIEKIKNNNNLPEFDKLYYLDNIEIKSALLYPGNNFPVDEKIPEHLRYTLEKEHLSPGVLLIYPENKMVFLFMEKIAPLTEKFLIDSFAYIENEMKNQLTNDAKS